MICKGVEAVTIAIRFNSQQKRLFKKKFVFGKVVKTSQILSKRVDCVKNGMLIL